jgi:hypothetical protein
VAVSQTLLVVGKQHLPGIEEAALRGTLGIEEFRMRAVVVEDSVFVGVGFVDKVVVVGTFAVE